MSTTQTINNLATLSILSGHPLIEASQHTWNPVNYLTQIQRTCYPYRAIYW